MDVVKDAESQLTEKAINEEVLACARETWNILKTIWYWKHRWLGHVFRHENIIHYINVKNCSLYKR